ncbi:MAG: radical SAM protein, partial [Candidatus Shapirobacteria bacterium]|nr:radical SAM protein [Candidatus Shapirobacteria bacterium]
MNVIEKIKKEKRPIIIVGAGIVGEVLYQACRSTRIKVECFCDNNINKTKTLISGVKVIHTPNLKAKYKKAVFLISTADIKDVVDQLKSFGYIKWYPCNLLLRDFDIYQYEFSKPIDFVAYAVATAILCHDSYMTPDKLFLRSVDIIVTEKCSLRCKECSNLMRYYKNPKDTDLKELIGDVDRLCSIVDEINEVRVLGGEPFMYKEVHLIIEKLIDELKVKKIVIYTNGTIIPRDEQLEYLKNNKVFFIVTNYGELSRNLDALTKKLMRNKIAFYVQKVGGWTNCSKIIKHNREVDEQRILFRNCCAKN